MRVFARLPLPGGGIWHCPGVIIRRCASGRVVFRANDGTLRILESSEVVA